FFVAQGASLAAVGLTSLFHLPWNLKAFVGPFVDDYGTKRKWLVGVEVLLAIALVIFSFVAALPSVLALASAMFVIVACLSATHDIAIDGLYLEAIDKDQQEALIGWRAPAYRVALLFVTSLVVVVCDKAGWAIGFALMAVVMTALLVFHAIFLPRTEREHRPLAELARRALSARFLAVAVLLALVVAAARWFVTSIAWWALGVSLSRAAPALYQKLAAREAADFIGIALLIALIVMLLALPSIKRRIERSQSAYGASFVSFLAQKHAGRILAWVILFRVGESFYQTMRYPFVHGQLGLTQSEFGVAQGTFGVIAGVISPVVGGFLIAQFGLKRCIWPFMIAMNGLHLIFCAAALFAHDIASATTPIIGIVDTRMIIATGIIVVENVGAGLATASFMVYLIRCCSPEHKAAHMALLTSVMSLSFTIAGVFSGFIADRLGFPLYFVLTFCVTIPGMVLTLFVPHIDGPRAQSLSASGSAGSTDSINTSGSTGSGSAS
ncbi:MAG TPA: MFS transporter, partial [Myxococcota bacterium]